MNRNSIIILELNIYLKSRKRMYDFVVKLNGYSKYIPIKGYGLDPYFRSAVALSVAPPPLPVYLAAWEGLAGGS